MGSVEVAACVTPITSLLSLSVLWGDIILSMPATIGKPMSCIPVTVSCQSLLYLANCDRKQLGELVALKGLFQQTCSSKRRSYELSHYPSLKGLMGFVTLLAAQVRQKVPSDRREGRKKIGNSVLVGDDGLTFPRLIGRIVSKS